MGDAIIVGILLVIVFCAISSSIKHFKGQGGCCGGETVREIKKLENPVIGKKIIRIDGMRCENCKNRVEHAINKLDGVTCKVKLKKKLAVVSYSVDIENAVLQTEVENLGYQVIGIVEK